MSQKLLVEDFLKNQEPNQTLNALWDKFEMEFPEVQKNRFVKNAKKSNYQFALYGISLTSPIIPNKELVISTIDLTNIDHEKFKAIPTGTYFDKIASKRNGIMPGTTYIITGESGAGKTTICTNIADYLKENNTDYTAGFISGEMDKDDWTEECLDNNRLADLETVFLLDYLDAPNYIEILEESLSKWDFVILDSFEVVIDQLKDIKGWTPKKAETKLIEILRKVASSTRTTIFAIQQYTKGGNFVGSNKIKHLLTGMIFVLFDKEGNRYVTFTKNRRGGHMVGKPLYFTKNKETGRLEFDAKRFDNEQAIQNLIEQQGESLEEEENIFDSIIMAKAKEKQEARKNILQNN